MIIHKFIVHVLDKNSETPILNDYEGRVSQETDMLFKKLIKRVIKDDDLRKGVFINYEDNVLRNCCKQIINDEKTFIQNSKEIASYLFEIMKNNTEIDSCDLAICLYTVKDKKYVAIMKLDYKKLYNHSIEFVEDKFNIQILTNEIAISDTQKQKQCALIGVNGINDEYHLKVLDKDAEKEGVDSKFVTDFLNVEKIEDDKYKTKKFKGTTENWITCALGKDVRQAEKVRSILNYELKEKDEIDINKFIDRTIYNEEQKESLKELMKEKKLEKINVDKKWVNKKLKKRNIKTDNGFDIKANLSNFEDPLKFEIIENENGKTDILIKNIEFYCEK